MATVEENVDAGESEEVAAVDVDEDVVTEVDN